MTPDEPRCTLQSWRKISKSSSKWHTKYDCQRDSNTGDVLQSVISESENRSKCRRSNRSDTVTLRRFPSRSRRRNTVARYYLTTLYRLEYLSGLCLESTRIQTREAESVKIMILNKLLQHPKIDVNIIDSSGNTPLIFAASSGNLTMVSLLINRGASIQNSTMNGTTPLHAACQEGHYKIVQFLIDLGAQVNVRDNL